MTLIRCRYAHVWMRWGQFWNLILLMDVEGKSREVRTPPQKQAAFLLWVSRKFLGCRCDSKSKTYFMVLSCEGAVSISNRTKELVGGRGGDTLENNKHSLSILEERGSYLWIPLPKPHQSKSTALLSVVILVWFLFLKWFQHVGLRFWNPASLWQKALLQFVNQLWIQVSVWRKGWVWVAVMKHGRIIIILVTGGTSLSKASSQVPTTWQDGFVRDGGDGDLPWGVTSLGAALLEGGIFLQESLAHFFSSSRGGEQTNQWFV